MVQKKQQFNVYLTDEQRLEVIDIANQMHARLGPTIRHLVLVGLEAERRRFGLPATADLTPVADPRRYRQQGDIPTSWSPNVAGFTPPSAAGEPLPSPTVGQDPFGADDVRTERS